jgi:hypothetical protein
VNVASAELAPRPSSVPSRTLGAGGVSFPVDAGSQLSAFLSLMTDVLEKIPAVMPRLIEPLPSRPLDATSAAVTSNDKSRGSTSDLNEEPTGGLKKDTKNHKEELPALPQPERPLPVLAAFLPKTPVAPEFPTSGPGVAGGTEQSSWNENGNAGGLPQHPDIAPHPSVTAPPALAPAAGDVAFALRLTLPIFNPVPVPRNTEDAIARSSPLAPLQSTKNNAVASLQDSSVTPGSTPKSKLSGVADAGPAYPSVHPPDGAAKTDGIPVLLRSLPGPNPAEKSGLAQPKPNAAKVEPVAKPEFREFRLSDGHVDASGKALAVPAWPSDAGGAPDTHGAPDTGAGSAPAGDSAARNVASEPEIKLAPPITRQISLNLSTDDSTQVNIGFTERAGKVLVAVRTTDHELTQSLRTDLGDLVGRLEGKGFKTETWIPAVAHQEAVPLQSSNSNTGFNQPQHSSPGNGGGQQRQGQNNSAPRQRQRWAAQLDETISADKARSES